MQYISINSLMGGRVFADSFSLLEAEGAQQHNHGDVYQIMYKGNILGTAAIVARSSYHVTKGLTDFYSWTILGVKLNKLVPDGKYVQIVLQWQHRDIAIQGELLEQWWQHVKTSQQINAA